jgi:hypothetical protein
VKLQPVLSQSAEIVIGVIVLFVFSILAFLFLIVVSGIIFLPMALIILSAICFWAFLNTLQKINISKK